ncbi:MAG: histidine phosphatase family protein [Clostridium sp.]|nr:histidine phosphatase family protein [Clostridium sp.]
MIRIFFVRHAQSEHPWDYDPTRPLSTEGKQDAKLVLEFLKDKEIETFYCSPYKRSIDTIKETANYFGEEIKICNGLRERENGAVENNLAMIKKRWEDMNYHEEAGESISMVQVRNVEVLKEILSMYDKSVKDDINLVIGTHGSALSSILHYYDDSFDYDAFIRIMDWTPYIISLTFDGQKLVHMEEHLHVAKESRKK